MDRTVKVIAALTAWVALVAAPPSALGAGRCDAPPGTAVVEEQCEFIPGPDRARGYEDRAGAGTSIAPRTVRELERGLPGQLVLQRLIDRDRRRDGLQVPTAGPRDRAPKPTRGALGEPSNDPFAAVGSALGGLGLAIAAAAIALLALALALSPRPGRRA